MIKVGYSPQSLKDLQNIKKYITDEYGADIAINIMRKITKDIRRLEMFPVSGQLISSIVKVPSDYYYLYSNKNYGFYRIENESVMIIRVLNEKQDYVQILFCLSQENGYEFDK